MEHIVDWFIVFTVLVGATVVIERLSTLFRRQKSRRHLQTVVMTPSHSEGQEPLVSTPE